MSSSSSSTSSSGLSLRDSLTTIEAHIHLPAKKKRKLEHPVVAASEKTSTSSAAAAVAATTAQHEDKPDNLQNEDSTGTTTASSTSTSWRIAYIHQMIPFLSKHPRKSIRTLINTNTAGKQGDTNDQSLASSSLVEERSDKSDKKEAIKEEKSKTNETKEAQETKVEGQTLTTDKTQSNQDPSPTNSKLQVDCRTDNDNDVKEEISFENDHYLKQQLEQLKKDNQEFQIQRQEILQRYVHLTSSYEYGLGTVRKLNDLRSAPDNFLKHA